MEHFNFNAHKLIKILRAGAGLIIGFVYFPIAWLWTRHPQDPVALAVSEILLLGFFGSKKTSLSARLLSRQIKHRQVNGVFFVGENIGNAEDLVGLKDLFTAKQGNTLIGIDHEGGAVQRISQRHGATKLPRALALGLSNLSFGQVKAIYTHAGKELQQWGFNLNFGPVLDVHDPKNSVIGRYGRSFGGDSNNITRLSAAFVDGFSHSGIICALKHFPGHGRSNEDSHYQIADISNTWSQEELAPYSQLISLGRAPIIMCGHLRIDSIEPSGCPASLSRAVIQGVLRERLGFEGVVATDDLDMEAISSRYSRRQAIIESLKAGNDLILFRNLLGYDPLLPKRILYWIRQSIKKGELDESRVLDAGNRVRALKNRFLGKSVHV